MANIKLKNNYWATEGIYDTTDSKTQKQVNADLHQDIENLVSDISDLNGALNDVVIVGDNTPFTSANIPSSAILKGTFILSSEYTMPERQVLVGEGATITVSGSGKILMQNYSSLENLNFVGDWSPTRTASGAHLVPLMTEAHLAAQTYITGSQNQGTGNTLITCTYGNSLGIKVIGCSFSNLDKWCVMINGGSHTSYTAYIISNNYFRDVWNAVGVYGEFGHINSNTFVRCVIGITVSSGNAEKSNNIFKQCDVGLYYIAATGNMAHGTMSGSNIAHCGLFAIYIKTISATTGEIITGCQIAEGGVKAEVANNLLFVGCRLDTWFNIVSGSRNKIANNIIRTAYLDGHALFTVPSDTIIRDNMPIDEATDSQVNPMLGSKRIAPSASVLGVAEEGQAVAVVDPVMRTVNLSGWFRNTSGSGVPVGTMNTQTGATTNAIFNIGEEYSIKDDTNPSVPTRIGIPATFVFLDGSTHVYFLFLTSKGDIYQGLSNNVKECYFGGGYRIGTVS